MKAGIIAAGLGTRLASSHPDLPKPLVPVAGRPLCHWVAASLIQSGTREITLLHNSRGRAVRESLEKAFPQVGWTFIEADTASSWESFRLVSLALSETCEEFLMSTVDAIIPPAEVRSFAAFCVSRGARAGLALTDFVEDEKPLWADIDAAGAVTALGEACRQRKYVTSGLYHMTGEAARRMPDAARYDSLRKFLIGLVEQGISVAGHPLSKTLDVDRPEDVIQAEGFLKEATTPW